LGIKMIDDRVQWWATKRFLYNVGLLAAGVVSFLLYVAIVWLWSDRLPCAEITAFTVAFQAIGFLFVMLLANVLYQLGPLAERIAEPKSPETFRKRFFALGFSFSLALPFIVPAAALLPVLGLVPVSTCG
jgi:hypothetical protein